MKKMIIASAAIVVMASCTESNDLVQTYSDSIVNFSSESIGTRTTTGEDGDSWLEGDPIGVYSVGFDTDYQNVQYLAQSDGASTTFKAADDDNAITYPNVASAKVNFYAYYPFSTLDKNNYIEIDISNQKGDYNAVDFMIAEHENVSYGVDKNTSNVVFPFNHKLSKVIINVKCNDNLASLSGLKASLSNVTTDASYNYKDDKIINGTTLNTINLTVIEIETEVEDGEDGEEVEVEVITATIVAILLPDTYTSSSTLYLSVGDNDYSSSFATTLKASYSHTFNIALGNDITGFESGSTIGEWGSYDPSTTLYPTISD